MVSLSYTIQDAKYSDFKLGFLKSRPVPKLNNVAIMTDDEWIQEQIKTFCLNHYINGKRMRAVETATPTVDRNIISKDVPAVEP